MRILYLTPGCFDKGGISRYCRYQISALRELVGHDNVRVYSVLGPDTDSFESSIDVTWSAGGLSIRSKLGFVSRVVAESVRFRPDVVLAAHINLSALACAIAAPVRAGTVLNTYGSEVWSGFRPDSAWGLKRSRRVIADCHFTARYLEEKGLRPGGSVGVIWDCVDLTQFHPGAPRADVLTRYGLPDPSSGLTLMTLGRMSANASHKGYQRLFDVFSRVAARVPNLRLVYGGRGDLVEDLQAQAIQAGLRDRVFFTGMIREEDLCDVYRAADIFSLISDRGPNRGEGIPLTPLEAAACGAPILVGNDDGSQEAVVQGVNGYVLDPFDLQSHAERIVELATDAVLRRRMSEGALQYIREEFTYERFVVRHKELFDRWFG